MNGECDGPAIDSDIFRSTTNKVVDVGEEREEIVEGDGSISLRHNSVLLSDSDFEYEAIFIRMMSSSAIALWRDRYSLLRPPRQSFT